MTSLNKSVPNTPDVNMLQMYDYFALNESFAKGQNEEGGPYNFIISNVPKEATRTSGNLTFQISPMECMMFMISTTLIFV
ncbi:MAG: hypothetical protein Ta2E_00220 [Mycoplasmoidaceae bacterium]|nr:MAG: hypothetical protein Ta2E_00220 [Mycoplasmoidaceae bacterium]